MADSRPGSTPISISQLSPGDKLSLKGKLFELQKKLTIIDMEHQQQPEYSFHPEIKNYDLPYRHENFTENVKRAEDIRQEKLEALKSTLEQEHAEACPFVPLVLSRRPDGRGDGTGPRVGRLDPKPAFERLYEQGREYKKSAEARRQRALQYDEDGNRLFSPCIPDGSRRRVGRTASSVGVDDFLYRAAMERNERLESMRQSAIEDAERVASQSKLNKKSEELLKRKYDRAAREAFDVLEQVPQSRCTPAHPMDEDELEGQSLYDTSGLAHNEMNQTMLRENNDNSSLSVGSGMICEGHVQEVLRLLCERDQWRHEAGKHVASGSEDPYYIASLVWKQLGGEGKRAMSLADFVSASVSAMLKKKTGQVDLLTHFVSRVRTLDLAPPPPPPQFPRGLGSDASEQSSRRGKYPLRRPDVGIAEATRDNTIEHEKRMEVLRRERDEKEMAECTFAPRILKSRSNSSPGYRRGGSQSSLAEDSINSDQKFEEVDDGSIFSAASVMSGTINSSRGTSKLPVHERLYALKNKIPDSILKNKHRRREEIEMDGCTFAPNLQTKVPPPPKPVFEQGVVAAIPQLAEAAGVHILAGGDIVFGEGSLISLQSSGVTIHTDQMSKQSSNQSPITANAQSPKAAISQPPPPPKKITFSHDSEHGDVSADASFDRVLLPRRSFITPRTGSFVSVLEEFKQSSMYASPTKPAAAVSSDTLEITPNLDAELDLFNPEDRNPNNFIGYSYKDLESEIHQFESSLISKETSIPVHTGAEPSVAEKSGLKASVTSSKIERSDTKRKAPKIPHRFAESVVRARLSREQRLRQEKAKEDLGAFSEDRYKKSRELAAKGTKPFSFRTDERLVKHAAAADTDNEFQQSPNAIRSSDPVARQLPPRLYVDIRLGNMKNVPKIAVVDNDDPLQLAKDFGKIYSLNDDAIVMLADVIMKSMRSNKIRVRGDPDSVETVAAAPVETITEVPLQQHENKTEPSILRSTIIPPPPPPRPQAEGPGTAVLQSSRSSEFEGALNRYFKTLNAEEDSDSYKYDL